MPAKQRGIASKKLGALRWALDVSFQLSSRAFSVELLHSNLRKMVLCIFLLSAQLCIFTLYQNSDEFCVVILIILIILLGHAVLRLHPVSTVAVCTFDGFSTEKSKSGHCTCGGRKPGTSFLMFYNLGLGGFPTRLCTVCILSSSQPPRLLVVS